jgi:hypothetical protein
VRNNYNGVIILEKAGTGQLVLFWITKTQAQLDFMHQDCELIEGYFYSRLLLLDELAIYGNKRVA